MYIMLEETGRWFGLVVASCFVLMSIIVGVLVLREKPSLFPVVVGFLLFGAGFELVVLEQIFGLSSEYGKRCAGLLVITGFILCFGTLFSISSLTAPFRTVTKCALICLALLLLYAFIISFIGLVDLLYLWVAGGVLPGPLSSFLRLEEWGVRGLGLFFGCTMLGFAISLATASPNPVDIRHGNSRFSFSGFKGATPGLRMASKITTSLGCLLAALFGFAVLFDVAAASLYVIRNASGVQIAWAILLFGSGILAYSAMSEKEWLLLTWILCIAACLGLLIAAEQFQPTADPTVVVRNAEKALDVATAASTIYEAGKFYVFIAFLLIASGLLLFDGKWIYAGLVLCIVGFMLGDGCDTPTINTRHWGATKLLD